MLFYVILDAHCKAALRNEQGKLSTTEKIICAFKSPRDFTYRVHPEHLFA